MSLLPSAFQRTQRHSVESALSVHAHVIHGNSISFEEFCFQIVSKFSNPIEACIGDAPLIKIRKQNIIRKHDLSYCYLLSPVDHLPCTYASFPWLLIPAYTYLVWIPLCHLLWSFKKRRSWKYFYWWCDSCIYIEHLIGCCIHLKEESIKREKFIWGFKYIWGRKCFFLMYILQY